MGVTVSTQKNEQNNSIHQKGGKGGSHLNIGGSVGGNNGGNIHTKNDGSVSVPIPVLINLDALDLQSLIALHPQFGGPQLGLPQIGGPNIHQARPF